VIAEGVQAGAHSPLRGELEERMAQAREADLEWEEVTALVISVLEERFAETTATACEAKAMQAKSTGE
jgi:hypothetical protein